ncbi:hypothetical protein AAVH_26658 [Aphelenchoides avenae]|nr:hypothetical protein AAVH_26658 [Aphelenchus avenae]
MGTPRPGEFGLSFDAIERLEFCYKHVDEDIPDDFILRCRAKGVKTLKLNYPDELQLQEPSEDELIQQFRAIEPIISVSYL